MIAPASYLPESVLADRWWLKRARYQRGWTVSRLVREIRAVAAEAGVTLPGDASMVRTVANWQSGKQRPGLFYAEILRRIFGWPPPADGFYPTDLRQLRSLG